MATLQQRFQTALEGMGWTVDRAKSRGKYIQMTHPNGRFRVYLGSAGALRYGNSVAGSVAAGDRLKQAILDGTNRGGVERCLIQR